MQHAVNLWEEGREEGGVGEREGRGGWNHKE